MEKNNLKPLPSLADLVLIRKQSDLKPFVTKDKSIIREFFHPLHETSKQLPENISFSIALAAVKPGQKTLQHIHEVSTEFYYIIRGTGTMQLNAEKQPIEENTLIYIPAKTQHTVANTGKEDLLILCICNPPYTHEDTIITSISEAC